MASTSTTSAAPPIGAALQKAVRQHQADVGIALDGDGDRVVMADDKGVLYDGDRLIYIIARHRQHKRSAQGRGGGHVNDQSRG